MDSKPEDMKCHQYACKPNPSKVHNHTPATEPKPSCTASTTTTVLMLQLQLVTVNLAFVVDAAYDDDDERTGMKPLRPPRRCPLGSPWAHRAPRGTLRPPCIRDGDEAGSIGEVEVSASRRDVDLVARNEKLPMAGHLSHTQLLPFRETQCPNTCSPDIQLASIHCPVYLHTALPSKDDARTDSRLLSGLDLAHRGVLRATGQKSQCTKSVRTRLWKAQSNPF